MSVLDYFPLPYWLALLILLLSIAYIYLTWNYGTLEALGYKTEKPWPLLGNLGFNLRKNMIFDDIARVERLGLVHGYYEGRNPTLHVADPEILRDVLVKDFNYFTDRRNFDISVVDEMFKFFLVSMKGEPWRAARNTLTPAFTSGKLKQMTGLMNGSSAQLVDILKSKAENNEDVDIKKLLVQFALDVISSTAFGIKINCQQDPEHQFVKCALKFSKPPSTLAMMLFFTFPKLSIRFLPIFDVEATAYLKNVITNTIRARQNEGVKRNDFLQLAIDAHLHPTDSNGSISDPLANKDAHLSVIANCFLFLLAGFDTISTTLSHVFYCLVAFPECQEKLIEEIDEYVDKIDELSFETLSKMQYLDQFISEALRFYPIATRIDRMCVKDYKGKITVPEGILVVLPVYAIHHNKHFFPNPEKFDPDRFSPERKSEINQYLYLPFGVGPRNCIGMRFAMMEMKVAITSILKHFRLRAGPETQIPLKHGFTMGNLIPEKPIKLRFEQR